MRARIYLIRHGRTNGNLEHRYVGITDEPLCREGVQELTACAQRLQAKFSANGALKPMQVYVSPMLRCRQTAAQLFPNTEPYVVEDFCEMHFGEFEYKNYAELADDVRYQAFIVSGGRIDFPGAETQKQFRDRVKSAFWQCAAHIFENVGASMADGPEEPFVFCVHGGTIMAVLDAYSAPHRDYFEWQVPNASGFCAELVLENNEFYLKNIERLW